MTFTRHCRAEWMIALAFVVLIPSLVGIWYVDHRRGQLLREAQTFDAWARYDDVTASCARGNILRANQSMVLTVLAANGIISINAAGAAQEKVKQIDCDLIPQPRFARP